MRFAHYWPYALLAGLGGYSFASLTLALRATRRHRRLLVRFALLVGGYWLIRLPRDVSRRDA